MTKQIPRGLRNNNPGNIRISDARFRGEADFNPDSSFKRFIGLKWGYRAMFVILNNYNKLYGLNTIRQMVGRWAPPSENDTDKYVNAVGRIAFMDVDTPTDTRHRESMLPIVAAMSYVENGQKAEWLYLEQGWEIFDVELNPTYTQ